MSRPSVDAVMSAVESLLSGAIDAERMPLAVEQLRQLFDGSKACIARVGPGLSSEDAISTNPDEAMLQRCYGDLADEFGQMAEAVRAIPIGDVYCDRDIFSADELRSSRVRREWMEPQDMYGGIACRLLESDRSFWFFDVQRGRSQEAFDSTETELLEKLSPVLQKVVAIRRHIGRLTLQRDEARGALDALAMGVVIVDQDMRIVYANEGADEILADQEGAVGLRQGKLFARRPTEHRQLKDLIEASRRGTNNPLEQQRCTMIVHGVGNHAQAVSACIMPAAASLAAVNPRSKVMIALRPLQMATDLVASARQLFDLTETEAKLASALAGGLSLAEAAETHGVRISTARTHLARVFQKTDTHQQSQLVSLLRAVASPLRAR